MNFMLKKLALFIFIFSSINFQCIAEGSLIKRKITKKTICKTWFVGEAWEIRGNNDKRDRSKKAKGSQFIFNEDHTFQLIDLSNNRKQTDQGTYLIENGDSISLTFERQVMKFHAVLLTKDSLTLTANLYGRKMFIGLSKDSIFPEQKNDFSEETEYGNEKVVMEESYEIQEPEPVVIDDEIAEALEEIVEETIVEETYEIPRKEPEHITRERAKNLAEMRLIGQWRTEASKKSFFSLGYNHYSITNNGELELFGSWTLSNGLIRITNSNGTFSYKILNQTNTRIKLSDLQTNKVIVLVK